MVYPYASNDTRMANQLVTEIVRARVKAALAAADSLSGVEHPLVKGRLRELVIDQLLRPFCHLPLGLVRGSLLMHSVTIPAK
jgi:hypothetical protein